MNYNINHEGWLIEQIPTAKRTPKHIAWLRSLQAPLVEVYEAFLVAKNKASVEANYNSQTMLFEHILNNAFDNTLRRIYIENSDSQGGISVNAALQSEGKPKILAYLQSEGYEKTLANLESELGGLDFIVYIPSDITNMSGAIDRMVRKYKLGGKEFQIVII